MKLSKTLLAGLALLAVAGLALVAQQTTAPGAQLVYSGAWSSYPPSPDDPNAGYLSGGTARVASAASAKATFTWTGTAVQVLMPKAGMLGKVKFTLDGGTPVTVDLYSSAPQPQQVVFSKAGLASKAHTLVIQPTGTKNAASTGTTVALDAIDSK